MYLTYYVHLVGIKRRNWLNSSTQQLGVTVLPTWACNKNRLAGGSDDWHEGKVGISPSLWGWLKL